MSISTVTRLDHRQISDGASAMRIEARVDVSLSPALALLWTRHMRHSTNSSEWLRLKMLNEAIDLHYGELAMDEVEIFASYYAVAIADLFEVVRVGKYRCRFERQSKPDQHFSVRVGDELTQFMKREDVFWAVFGQKDEEWNLLSFGPSREPLGH
jgi:hypothetical protein